VIGAEYVNTRLIKAIELVASKLLAVELLPQALTGDRPKLFDRVYTDWKKYLVVPTSRLTHKL
jgi:hypothetical protein